MSSLPLSWTLLASLIWTYVSCQIPGESAIVRYPAIRSSETLDCNCLNINCDRVYWLRSIPTNKTIEFVGRCNNANRIVHGNVDKERYQLSKKSPPSFTLRIVNITEADAGIYSCILIQSGSSSKELFQTVAMLRPGETPPTIPTTTKTQTKPKPRGCDCNSKDLSGDCSNVIWTLEGLIGGLTLAVICTLYYFSRLPKKCKHHFVKKRMT